MDLMLAPVITRRVFYVYACKFTLYRVHYVLSGDTEKGAGLMPVFFVFIWDVKNPDIQPYPH